MVCDINTAVRKAKYVIDEFQGCKFASERRGSLDFLQITATQGGRGPLLNPTTSAEN